MNRSFRKARILGVGLTKLGRLGKSSTCIMSEALDSALLDAGIAPSKLDGIIAIPSLSSPHFMEGHHFATKIGLAGLNPGLVVRTIDTGGAGPVTAILEAKRLIETEGLDSVAVVAGDAVLSLDSPTFFERADGSCQNKDDPLPSPVIPHGYDLYAQWHLKEYGVSREHLAMAAVCMSDQARRHPNAMCQRVYSLDEVLSSRRVAPVTNLLECARRADGGGAVIIGSTRFRNESCDGRNNRDVVILGGGEGSGPLYPLSRDLSGIKESHLDSCEAAMSIAYEQAQLRPNDIDVFLLYDCFSVCLLRAIESCGLCKKGEGHHFIQDWYERILNGDTKITNVNTHGGLMAFGAPWETPAIFNVIEAVEQISGTATSNRAIENCQRALVYGNGGIFSASSVAILSQGVDSSAWV